MSVMSRNPKDLVYDVDKINNALVRDLVFSLLLALFFFFKSFDSLSVNIL